MNYYTTQELFEQMKGISFNKLCIGSSGREKLFGVDLPNVTDGRNEYHIKYNNYEKKICLELRCNKFVSKEEFDEMFFRKFSELKCFELEYVSGKLWKIIQGHITAYDNFRNVNEDFRHSEVVMVIGENEKYPLVDLSDKNVVPMKDIEICKGYAVAKGIFLELLLGGFKFENEIMIRDKCNVYNVSEKDRNKCSELFKMGCSFDPYRGGWDVPDAVIDETLCVCRSVAEDMELKKYISQRIEDCP